MTTLLLAILACAQDGKEDVAAAVRATLEKGSFTFQIAPVANIKDVLPQDRVAVAGVKVAGEQLADGTFRTSDGTSEVFGRDKALVIKTSTGWRPAEEVVAEIIRDIKNEVGKDDWRHGNVTQAKASYRRLLAMAHLYVRSVPPVQLLGRIESDFRGLRKTGTEIFAGKKCPVYEGEITEAAARLILQGPYAEQVKEGTLILSEVSGRGRVWIGPDGLVRRTEFRAAGKYTVVDRDRNTRRTEVGSIQVTCDFLKVGETKLDVPRQVDDLLRELQASTQTPK